MTCFASSLALLVTTLVNATIVPQTAPRVRTILFFSPSCPHCHTVISEGLPPLVERFGPSLVIVAINTQSFEGQRLFQEAGRRYGIAPDHLGVPLLVVGDRALIGSFEIPDQLPGIVEEGLADGGIPWPEIDGLLAILVAAGIETAEPPPAKDRVVAEEAVPALEAEDRVAAEEAVPVVEAAPGATPSTDIGGARPMLAPHAVDVVAPEPRADLITAPEIIEAEKTLAIPTAQPQSAVMDLAAAETRTGGMTPWQKFDQDRAGNSLALFVLAGMIVSILAVLVVAVRRLDVPNWPGWIVAGLIVAGLTIAAYLSYVEVTRSEAFCGPVGDCNTVQQSSYARLFGVLPIGVLGMYGYTVLGLGWLLRDRGSPRWNTVIATGLWLGALLGTLFSIYLTVLEPFVIGATCLWCVTSAILMTLLLWATTPAAVESWNQPEQV
jgi:uncharacterized membrane protein